jgi:general secretion pathway protein G
MNSFALAGAGSGPSCFVPCTSPHKKYEGQSSEDSGFTLLELMIVLVLILVIASMATPMYDRAINRAREAALRDDLFTMRQLIDQFTLDKQRPPQSLEELVEAGYLRGGVPEDPMTHSRDTWRVDFEDVVVGSNQAIPGIVDVHSGSDDVSSDGMTPYSSW